MLNASMSGAPEISMAAAGLLADRQGVPIAFTIGGAGCFAAGLLGLVLSPRAESRRTIETVAGATHAEAAGPSS